MEISGFNDTFGNSDGYMNDIDEQLSGMSDHIDIHNLYLVKLIDHYTNLSVIFLCAICDQPIVQYIDDLYFAIEVTVEGWDASTDIDENINTHHWNRFRTNKLREKKIREHSMYSKRRQSRQTLRGILLN